MNSPITVMNVNRPEHGFDISLYCGRNPNRYPNLINAKLGNPFHMDGECQRDEVCNRYADWLGGEHEAPAYHRRAIQIMAQRVQEGKTLALYCHCAPKRCHCDEIRRRALIEAGSLWSDEAEPSQP